MSLLGATVKTAKKLADEWDEAAWLKENPRPEGTARGSKEVRSWYSKRDHAKNNVERRAAQDRYTDKNKDKIADRKRNYDLENKDKKSEKNKDHYQENKKDIQEKRASYFQDNKEAYAARRAKYRSTQLEQTPAYSNDEAIGRIYEQAGLLSKSTGIPHEVDHVFPLQGKDVRGLHVPANLMITPRDMNRGKSNAFTPGDDPMKFNDQALKNIREQNEKGLLGGFADPTLLAGTAAGTAAGLIAAPMVKDSGMISSPRSETLFDLTMGARDVERRLEGNPASLLFPSGLVDYLEAVNRREEKPNATTRGMALLDVLPF